MDSSALAPTSRGSCVGESQTEKCVIRCLVAEAARDFQNVAGAVGGLLGAVDDRKHRAAMREGRVDGRQD